MKFIGDKIEDEGIREFIEALSDLKRPDTLTTRFLFTKISKEIFLQFITK